MTILSLPCSAHQSYNLKGMAEQGSSLKAKHPYRKHSYEAHLNNIGGKNRRKLRRNPLTQKQQFLERALKEIPELDGKYLHPQETALNQTVDE